MGRLSRIPRPYLSLHPIAAGNNEFALPPLPAWRDEFCRLCQPSGMSIHLLGHIQSNAVVMIVYLGPPGGEGEVWRIHIHMDLWLSGELQRTAEGIEPLFEFHPLGWASEAHKKIVDKWGADHGVQAAAVPGLSRRLFIWKRTQD